MPSSLRLWNIAAVSVLVTSWLVDQPWLTERKTSYSKLHRENEMLCSLNS